MRLGRIAALLVALMLGGCGAPSATVIGLATSDLTVVVDSPGTFHYTLGSGHCGFAFTLELQRAGADSTTLERGSGSVHLDQGTWVVESVQYRDEIHRECDLELTLAPA